MLSKKLKLDRLSFPTHLEKKQIWSGTALRIYYYPSSERSKRFTVVVSKKQFSTHVAKNTFKRSVFDAISLCQPAFAPTPFGKFVLYPTRSVESISRNDIRLNLETFLKEYVPTKTTH